jgi:hypothetical protein
MEKKVKILVIPSDRGGCGYFRSVQPHVFMAENHSDKFDIDIVYKLPTEGDLAHFLKQYDIVHIHKQLDGDLTLANTIKFCGCKLVVDVDDYYDLGNDHPMSATAKAQNWKAPIMEHLKFADMVTTTTEIYRQELLKLNKNVVVIPNSINPQDEQFVPKPTEARRLRFGLICGSSHLNDIKLLEGVVKQLSSETLDKIQFVLCGFDTRERCKWFQYLQGKAYGTTTRKS